MSPLSVLFLIQTLLAFLVSSPELPNKLPAQTIPPCELEGRIVDTERRALPGVTIREGGTSNGTASRADGTFLLKRTNEASTELRISAVGYSAILIPLPIGTCPQLGDIVLPTSVQSLHPVLVSATRTVQSLEGISLPARVIGKDEITQRAAHRLSDLLAEINGLQVVYDFGLGVQMQGFDPDYTLIMVDGDPLIGRTAGTLDLRRIPLADVRQVEIVKGPSSSLYGSEALAGVIHIITDQADTPFRMQGGLWMGAMGYADVNTQLQWNQKPWQQSVYINHNRSDGYDLDPTTSWATQSKTWNSSIKTTSSWAPNERWRLKASLRAFQEQQRNQDAFLTTQRGFAKVNYFAQQWDGSVSSELTYQTPSKLRYTFRNLYSIYETDAFYTYQDNGVAFDPTVFRQTYWRPEASMSRTSLEHEFISGAGWIAEGVRSDRYLTGSNQQHTLFFFAQHEWEPSERWSILGGLRLDLPSTYDHNLSPRVSASYRVGALNLRMAMGTGFKSPDFRHLYLDFFNSAGSYRVLGSKAIASTLRQLQDQGSLRFENILIAPESLMRLRPEESSAINLGIDYRYNQRQLSLNLFHNKVSNLIEYTRAAVLDNGQTLFTYQNVNRVALSGFEVDAAFLPLSKLDFRLGYQFLDSRDLNALERIKTGNVYRRDSQTGEVTRVRRKEYGGLVNRSRHNASFSIHIYDLLKQFDVTLRATYRSRYGFSDQNGNGVIDHASEYGRAYLMVNASMQKQFSKHLELHASLLNLFDYKNAIHLPTTPGRQLQVGIRLAHPN